MWDESMQRDDDKRSAIKAELNSARKGAAVISVVVGVLMFFAKSGGYLITGSAAILSDAMESVVHVVATSMALYSIVLAARPADKRHPYGYGKIEYFSAGVEGLLILLAALAICVAAARDLISGPQLRSLDVGVWVVGSAGVVNLVLGLYLVRSGKKHRSLVLVADGKHVLTDSYTSIGVLVGLMLVKITDVVILDPLFAIAVAINILFTGYQLVRQSVGGLMNIAEPDTLERTVAAMNRIRTRDMLDMHRLRAWRAGESVFVDFHLTLPSTYTLEHAHDVQHEVADAICAEFHDLAQVMVHLDPADPDVCLICGDHNCSKPECLAELNKPFTVEQAVAEPRRLPARWQSNGAPIPARSDARVEK